MTEYNQFQHQVQRWSDSAISLLTQYSFSESVGYNLYINNKFEIKAVTERAVFPIKDYKSTGITSIYSPRNKTYDAEHQKVLDTIDSSTNHIFVVGLNFAAWMTSACISSDIHMPIMLNPKMIERIHKIYSEIGFMSFSPKINKKGTIFARDYSYNNDQYHTRADTAIRSQLFPGGLSSKRKQAYLDEQIAFEAELASLYQPIIKALNSRAIKADRKIDKLKVDLKAAVERNREKSSVQSTTPVILTWS